MLLSGAAKTIDFHSADFVPEFIVKPRKQECHGHSEDNFQTQGNGQRRERATMLVVRDHGSVAVT